MYEDSYKLYEACDQKLNKMVKEFSQLRSEVDEAIEHIKNLIEVEDFLENGPGGRDPF